MSSRLCQGFTRGSGGIKPKFGDTSRALFMFPTRTHTRFVRRRGPATTTDTRDTAQHTDRTSNGKFNINNNKPRRNNGPRKITYHFVRPSNRTFSAFAFSPGPCHAQPCRQIVFHRKTAGAGSTTNILDHNIILTHPTQSGGQNRRNPNVSHLPRRRQRHRRRRSRTCHTHSTSKHKHDTHNQQNASHEPIRWSSHSHNDHHLPLRFNFLALTCDPYRPRASRSHTTRRRFGFALHTFSALASLCALLLTTPFFLPAGADTTTGKEPTPSAP